MNHHFLSLHPRSSGTPKGNHEHERTVRATIIIVIPLSAFLRSTPITPFGALAASASLQEQLFDWRRLTTFQPSHSHPPRAKSSPRISWPSVDPLILPFSRLICRAHGASLSICGHYAHIIHGVNKKTRKTPKKVSPVLVCYRAHLPWVERSFIRQGHLRGRGQDDGFIAQARSYLPERVYAERLQPTRTSYFVTSAPLRGIRSLRQGDVWVRREGSVPFLEPELVQGDAVHAAVHEAEVD